ncbi:MAG: tetratricopeptide repeat protein [Woeseiaceae bacterium]
MPFGFPDWTITLTAVLFVVGFPVAMFVEWTFDIGPDGIRRTPPSPQGRLAIASAAVLLIAGTAGLFYLIKPAAETARSDWSGVAFAPPAYSIAVLPFDVIAADRSELEWLGDGFAETLLHYLAQLDSLHVIARTSAFSFKDREDLDIRQIGRQLNVATILEGSVQKAGGELRITAQLIDVEDGRHLWSQVYDRPEANLFEIQDEIAEAVSARLLDTLVASRTPINRATTSREAYDLYLLGRYHWHRRSEQAIRTAIDYFQQAVARDPGYALAYSGLADAYSVLPDYSRSDIAEVAEPALNAARTAVQLAPDLAEGHGSIGLVHMQLGDFAAAEAAFQRAATLNPNYAMAHVWQGRALLLRGKITAAHRHHERALQLDPLAPVVNLNVGIDLTWMGLYDRAVERFERAVELSPDMANAYFGAAVAHHHAGELAEAADWFDQTLRLGRVTTLTLRQAALLHLDLGDDARADQLLEQARALADDDFVGYARRLFCLARSQPEELVRLADELPEAEPERPASVATAGLAYSFAGDCTTALGHFERLPPSGPSSGSLFDLWEVLYANSPAVAMLDCNLRLGRTTAAQALREQIQAHREMLASDGLGGARVHYFDAQLAAVQGQREPAIAHLARAVDAGWRQHRRAMHDPALESLREDARFTAMMTEVAARVAKEREQLEASTPGDDRDDG